MGSAIQEQGQAGAAYSETTRTHIAFVVVVAATPTAAVAYHSWRVVGLHHRV